MRSYVAVWSCLARVDLASALLHPTVHSVGTEPPQLAQDLHSVPENGVRCGTEPAVAAGPALDPIVLQTDAYELRPCRHQAFIAPAVAGRYPRLARRHAPGFWHRPLQGGFDVLHADGQDQVSLFEHFDIGASEVQGMPISQVEGRALFQYGYAQQLN